MRNALMLIIVVFMLMGCAGGGITESGLSAIMSGTGQAGDQIVEASVAKEAIVHKTQQVRLTQYKKMYDQSGLKVSFEVKEVDGVKILTPNITYRPKPEVIAVNMEPSKHPFWRFAGRFGDGLMKYGFGGYAVHEFSGVLKAGYNSATAQTVYEGDYTPQGSNNDFRGDFQGDYVSPITKKEILPEVPSEETL